MSKTGYKFAILVPIYKELSAYSTNEKRLFEQIKKIFPDKPILLFGPHHLESIVSSDGGFKFIAFDVKFFKDKYTYSELLCSLEFYQSFANYDFIQIVQTDCWVFEDKLDYFASADFDYLGAPWMKNGFEGKPVPKLWKVGNGGFSLRKVSSFLSIINQIKKTKKGTVPVFKNFDNGIIGTLKKRGINNNLRHYIKSPPGEDIFWSIYVPLVFKTEEFKVADVTSAAFYSFETLPQYLYEKVTNGILPMGCHNWERNNLDFWRQHISSQGARSEVQ